MRGLWLLLLVFLFFLLLLFLYWLPRLLLWPLLFGFRCKRREGASTLSTIATAPQPL
jgi:hypothetical protein